MTYELDAVTCHYSTEERQSTLLPKLLHHQLNQLLQQGHAKNITAQAATSSQRDHVGGTSWLQSWTKYDRTDLQPEGSQREIPAASTTTIPHVGVLQKSF